MLWSYLFLCLGIANGSRMFYSSDMCKPRNVSDCSFQIPGQLHENCLIYHTNVCDKYLSTWEKLPLSKLKSENESPVSISILPYQAAVHPKQKSYPVSAINLTFTFLIEGVNGIAFYLINDAPVKNICRIFDFRLLQNGPNISNSIYYDCLNNLVENSIQNVEMKFRVLPMYTELSYYVFIPPTGIFDGICTWKPLVLIFQGNLDNGYVNIRFTKAPEHFNVSYHVRLVSVPSNEEILGTNHLGNMSGDFLMVDFTVTTSGYYAVWIRISEHSETFCNFTKTKAFFVGGSLLDRKIILYAFIIVLLGVSASASVVFIFTKFLKPALKEVTPRLLLIYSYDCMEHESVILAFIKFLKTFEIHVHTIYETSGNPIKWLQNKYEESNAVVFCISEGLFHTYEKKDKRMLKVGHHCRNQLSVAEAIITHDFYSMKSSQKKKICHILFPFSNKEHIPKCVQRISRKQFYFTNKVNHFLCFLFDCVPRIPFQSAHKWISKDEFKNMTELKDLHDAIDRMKIVVAEKHHIHFLDEKIDELQEDNYHASHLTITDVTTSFNKNSDENYHEKISEPQKSGCDLFASSSSSNKQYHETFQVDDVFRSLVFSDSDSVNRESKSCKPSCDNKPSNVSDSSAEDEFRILIRKEFQSVQL